MNPNAEAQPVRRVLVALDASPGSRAVAEAAAQLAAMLETELCGLFIEDLEVLHLSRSPMARQADLLTASVSNVGSQDVEQQLRVQAERARRILSRAAGRARLSWTFRVVRGSVASEIHQASTENDLISLGLFGWSLRHRRHLGRTARHLLGERQRRVLLIDRLLDLRRPVLLVYEQGDAARRALALALQLTGGRPRRLVVAVPDSTSARRREIEDRIRQEASETCLLEIRTARSTVKLGHLAHSRRCGLAILPMGGHPAEVHRVQEMLDRIPCPVLIVS